MRKGRPLKNPELGPRIPLCVRVPVRVGVILKTLAAMRLKSQSDIVIEAILKEAKK